MTSFALGRLSMQPESRDPAYLWDMLRRHGEAARRVSEGFPLPRRRNSAGTSTACGRCCWASPLWRSSARWSRPWLGCERVNPSEPREWGNDFSQVSGSVPHFFVTAYAVNGQMPTIACFARIDDPKRLTAGSDPMPWLKRDCDGQVSIEGRRVTHRAGIIKAVRGWRERPSDVGDP